jgi:hypothetical protein
MFAVKKLVPYTYKISIVSDCLYSYSIIYIARIRGLEGKASSHLE